MKRVLVIRLGALGDIVLSFPAFAAIRAAHPQARITLLTTAPFAGWLSKAPWFNHILIDDRPAFWNLRGIQGLRIKLAPFEMVYDLQTSSRSSWYLSLANRPIWSGIARGCAYRHTNPQRDVLHTRERIADQLKIAGISGLPVPDLGWLRKDVPDYDLPKHFAALVPGAAPHRPAKRWPAANFADLATRLKLPAVILGSKAEQPLAAHIRQDAAHAIDLTGRTDLAQLAAILSHAALAIGSDTGPMHLATALGVPSIVLFGADSDPALTAPRYPDGGWPTILRVPDLADLPVDRVAAALP